MRIRISDGRHNILDHEVPDDAKFAEFNKHKKNLLSMLRNEHERDPESKPFDEDKAWRSLTGLAGFYFRRGSVKQTTMLAADRIERLRDIAKKLRQARLLVDRTLKTGVGDELFSAWWERTGSKYAKPDGSFDPRYMERKFKKAVESLVTLETAASYGASHVARPKRGRPPVLPWDDIWNLAVFYRDSTGSVPGAGDGPFARFVMQVLIAASRSDDIEYQSLVEAIKGVRQWALTHPVARKWAPSPFDEEV